MTEEKDIEKLPSIRGLKKQMEAYWENQNEIESMLLNQAAMEKDPEIRNVMSQMYAGFCWENAMRAMSNLGGSVFPQLWEQLTQAQWTIVSVMREKRQKALEAEVLKEDSAPSNVDPSSKG